MAGEQFILVIEGLELGPLEELPSEIRAAARMALNRGADRARTMLAAGVLQEISLPPAYVSPRDRRLYVSKRANSGDLEAVITAQSRRTSLAQFVQGRPGGKNPAGVQVKVGRDSPARRLKRAFLVKMRSGAAGLDTKAHMGLAYRTQNGERPPGYVPTQLAPNLWLLYGPSVSQILQSASDGSGVASEMAPKIADAVIREFDRQMERLI